MIKNIKIKDENFINLENLNLNFSKEAYDFQNSINNEESLINSVGKSKGSRSKGSRSKGIRSKGIRSKGSRSKGSRSKSVRSKSGRSKSKKLIYNNIYIPKITLEQKIPITEIREYLSLIGVIKSNSDSPDDILKYLYISTMYSNINIKKQF